MATQVFVNFGFTGTDGITITEKSGLLLQSSDYSAPAEVEVTRDGVGAEVNHSWYNSHEEATLECVFKDGASTGGAISATSLSAIKPGTLITITALAGMPDIPHASNKWEVQSTPRITGSNVNAKKVSIPLKRFPGITSSNIV